MRIFVVREGYYLTTLIRKHEQLLANKLGPCDSHNKISLIYVDLFDKIAFLFSTKKFVKQAETHR